MSRNNRSCAVPCPGRSFCRRVVQRRHEFSRKNIAVVDVNLQRDILRHRKLIEPEPPALAYHADHAFARFRERNIADFVQEPDQKTRPRTGAMLACCVMRRVFFAVCARLLQRTTSQLVLRPGFETPG